MARESLNAPASLRSRSEHVSGAKLGASGVRNQLAVVDQVRRSLTSHRLVDESGQLVVDRNCLNPLLTRRVFAKPLWG